MRKLFLTLYFKMFLTMALLTSIGVLAFYTLHQRQQQLYLLQHHQLLQTQLKVYFQEKFPKSHNTVSRNALHTELLLLQQSTGLIINESFDSKENTRVLPGQKIESVIELIPKHFYINLDYQFEQNAWLKQFAYIIKKRVQMQLADSKEVFVDGNVKGLSIKTSSINMQNYTDYEVNQLISELPLIQKQGQEFIQIQYLINPDQVLNVRALIYEPRQSIQILFYTLLMVMFLGLFMSVLYIKPIEKRMLSLLKGLDKQKTNIDDKQDIINFPKELSKPKDEIDLINLKVTQMMQRMRQLANDQQEMTRAVSHEFRTPIVKMGFHVNMLEDQVGLEDESIIGLKQNMKELHKLVDELLLYSSLEHSSQITFESFNLRSALNNLINQLQGIKEVELHLMMDEDIQMKANENYVIRAVQNLITNAQRYAKKQILILVTQKNHQIFIRVEDDGIGLNDQQKNTVFEPFQVLEKSRNKKLAGHGLGLAIVKRIVLLHGAKAYVDDPEKLTGASFVLQFPLRAI